MSYLNPLLKQIPFQVISQDSSYVTIRIDVHSNHTVFEGRGRNEGSVFSIFVKRLFDWGFGLSGLLFFLCLIIYWLSKKCIIIIK